MSELALHSGAYDIKCNGTPLGAAVDIQSIRVTQEVSMPTMFEIVVPTETTENAWNGMDFATFRPGYAISIALGIGMTKPLVQGAITGIWPDLHSLAGDPNRSTVTVVGFDDMNQLRFGTRTRSIFGENNTDLDVVEAVVGSTKVAYQACSEAKGVNMPYALQHNESDYEFLMRLCRQRNYELFMDSGKLTYRPSAQGRPDGQAKKLEYRLDFDTCRLELSVPMRGKGAKALGYDITTGKVVDAQSDSSEKNGYDWDEGFADTSVQFERPGEADAEALLDLVNAQYARGVARFLYGVVRLSTGDSTLIAGTNVNLTGLGDKYSGLYYIVKAIHKYENNQYDTELEVQRSGI